MTTFAIHNNKNGHIMNKRLYRSKSEKMIAGVCGGLGEYLDVDPTIIRIAFACLCIFSVVIPGLLLYIIMALIMPQNGGYLK